MKNIPRAEHPRPGFVRESWKNLNGEWSFYRDLSSSGYDRKFYEDPEFPEKITVPFCPESELSGIGFKDFMPTVWYGKTLEVTESDLSGRVILHFGACDYLTTLWINKKPVGKHIGGYASFEFDITDYLVVGENALTLSAYDDNRAHTQHRGKQSSVFYSVGCDYTRTTGIWQTVWLEFVPEIYLTDVAINATDLGGTVLFDASLNAYAKDATLEAAVSYKGNRVAENKVVFSGSNISFGIAVPDPKLWNPGAPELYDVCYTLKCGNSSDEVKSYFGIRRIDIDGKKVLINGKSVFQRLILDQGFYPDGIYTAPSDEALCRDIELCMALGFNGARLHQKVFEERFLYHADKLGYIVWGEYPDWGFDPSDDMNAHAMLPEWLEVVKRDRNHPSIIGWCPHNETSAHYGRVQIDTNVSMIYDATKALDRTRPVIDTSGYTHTDRTDIYDIHQYDQRPEFYRELIRKHDAGEYYANPQLHNRTYDGKKPFFVSEYGGIKWYPESQELTNDKKLSWGYGDAPKTPEEFRDRYVGLTEAIMSSPGIMGFCYTQLTDVEQEQNGLYFYDRGRKFNNDIYDAIREVNTRKAAIED